MLPPGPRLPSVVQMAAWVRAPYPFLDRCRDRHGATFTVRLPGFGSAVFTDDPDLIHAVFTADPAVLEAGKGNDILQPFLGDRSLLTLDGPAHARDRKLMTPPFHGARMRAYGRVIAEATERAIYGWVPGTVTPTHPAMQRTSLDVILRAVMGVETAEVDRGRAIITDLLDSVGPSLMFVAPLRRDYGPWSPWGRYSTRRAAAETLLTDAIALRRAQPGEDILSLLLAARDEHGAPLTDEELRAELITLLLAGHETTATALAWALAWLVAEPEVLARLVEEVDTTDDVDAIGKLPWLGAVCAETLRILPVFPIVMRIAATDWSHGDLHLPAGTRIAPCIYLLHRRPDLYPDPDRFSPARFLDRTPSASEYIPFGGGVRRCIGAAFALYEMRIALATVLRKFTLGVATGRPVAERRNIAMAPRGGATVRVVARR